MYSVLFEDCRTELNYMSPNLSVLALLPKSFYFLPGGANIPPRLIPSLLLLNQPIYFIFCKILLMLNILMTVDFLFLPKAAYLLIYLLLKPRSSKLLTPPSADKKNLSTVQLKDSALMTVSHWSFSSQSRLGLFL